MRDDVTRGCQKLLLGAWAWLFYFVLSCRSTAADHFPMFLFWPTELLDEPLLPLYQASYSQLCFLLESVLPLFGTSIMSILGEYPFEPHHSRRIIDRHQ